MFQVPFQVQDGWGHDNVWPVADKPNVQQSVKQNKFLKVVSKKTVKLVQYDILTKLLKHK